MSLKHPNGLLAWQRCDILMCLHQVSLLLKNCSPPLTVPTGSWEGNIRIWKLDAKLKSFSLVGVVPVPGFINSLQFVTVPKTFSSEASWTRTIISTSRDTEPNQKRRDLGAHPFLLIAGTGQEPRLGRWMKVTEGGAKNAAYVWAFEPRTM